MCLVDGEVYGWNETWKRPTRLSPTFLAPIRDQFDFFYLLQRRTERKFVRNRFNHSRSNFRIFRVFFSASSSSNSIFASSTMVFDRKTLAKETHSGAKSWLITRRNFGKFLGKRTKKAAEKTFSKRKKWKNMKLIIKVSIFLWLMIVARYLNKKHFDATFSPGFGMPWLVYCV
jgi:hypothetical protein